MNNDISKLPKWAQSMIGSQKDYISVLERELDRKRSQMERTRIEVNPYWGMSSRLLSVVDGPETCLPESETVRYCTTSYERDHIDVRLRENRTHSFLYSQKPDDFYLEICGSETLAVVPCSSNLVQIYLPRG